MSLLLVLIAMSVLLVSGVVAAFAGSRDRFALGVGTAGGAVGSVIGTGGALVGLFSADTPQATARWPLALGALRVGVDALSAFFLLCVFVVSGLSALYAFGYFRDHAGRRRLASPVAFMNALAATMAAVVIARDAVAFLAAWEAMSLASFFLVLFYGERGETRRAAIVYLTASHVGALPLFVVFLALSGNAHGFAFAALGAAAPPAALASTCFVLALVGFGAKAGFWPMHVWLPEAHPAAPSPVSAVMSGVMIKMGIYGLVRVLTFLGPPPAWWGVVVVCIGAVSGIAGVLHAVVQRDLKRLLAYCSVENIGIIALGLGIGLLGQAHGRPTVAFLGYAGGLLHVLNHGLFKGLLFHGAGSIEHGAGTRDISALGGLLRRMPTTALTFLVGSVAISGLPPFNGFISEVLIYAGAFCFAVQVPWADAGWALGVLPALALIGGLAAACFVKAYGMVFLGEGRTEASGRAHESGAAMRVAMVVGALLCVAIGVVPALGLLLVRAPSLELTGLSSAPTIVVDVLSGVTTASLVLVAVVLVLVAVRRALVHGRDVRAAATWGCGYEAPSPRMQYTEASFAEPVVGPFLGVFRRREEAMAPNGYFPSDAAYDEQFRDRADSVLRPAVRGFVGALAWAQRLERGGTRRYLVYVLVTLVALLVWQLALGN